MKSNFSYDLSLRLIRIEFNDWTFLKQKTWKINGFVT